MRLGEFCNRSVVVIDRSESVLAAAKLMRKHNVGDVVIMGRSNGKHVPVAIVTDRDLVLEILAEQVDPESVEIGDIFARKHLVTGRVDDDLDSALDAMQRNGVRRMPVLDEGGSLAGIVTMDDLLEEVTDQMTEIVKLIESQRGSPRHAP